MNIPQCIGDIWDAQRSRYESLAAAVEPFIRGRMLREWHFIGRIKTRESFALKVETGRVPDPQQLEDFYACTVVVRNMAEVAKAESLIVDGLDLASRRPVSPTVTRLEPHSFEFDHLRLYVRWRDDESLPPSEFSKLVFEVQIKTYLQHAWAIATHDLTYKTDDVNWTKARIAYQVKAMLDHAEASIAHASELASVADIQVSTRQFDEIRAVIELIKQTWTDRATLPDDVRRLAETIHDLISGLGITVADLKSDLDAETEAGRGLLIRTLSPFGVVVHTMLQRRHDEMKRLLTGANRRVRRNYRVVIPAEIKLPPSIPRDECAQAIFVD